MVHSTLMHAAIWRDKLPIPDFWMKNFEHKTPKPPSPPPGQGHVFCPQNNSVRGLSLSAKLKVSCDILVKRQCLSDSKPLARPSPRLKSWIRSLDPGRLSHILSPLVILSHGLLYVRTHDHSVSFSRLTVM